MNADEVIKKALRVIEEEIEGLKKLGDSLDQSFVRAVELILSCEGKVVVTGIGKSGHIGRKIASTLASTGTPAHFVHPSEALHGDLGVIDQKDVVIAISNSGESPEVLSLVPYLKMHGVPIIGITNSGSSSLARYSDVHLCLNVDREACPLDLAPTTSSTATLVLGDALAMVLMEMRGFTREDFAIRHPAGSLGRKLRLVKDLYHTGDEVPVVNEETPMSEAIIVMTAKGFGATAVVDSSGKLTGIITDGDLRRFVNRGGNFDKSLARDVMTRDPKTARPDELALKALRRMEDHKITVLIVVDDKNKPVGIIHMHDILRSEIV